MRTQLAAIIGLAIVAFSIPPMAHLGQRRPVDPRDQHT